MVLPNIGSLPSPSPSSSPSSSPSPSSRALPAVLLSLHSWRVLAPEPDWSHLLSLSHTLGLQAQCYVQQYIDPYFQTCAQQMATMLQDIPAYEASILFHDSMIKLGHTYEFVVHTIIHKYICMAQQPQPPTQQQYGHAHAHAQASPCRTTRSRTTNKNPLLQTLTPSTKTKNLSRTTNDNDTLSQQTITKNNTKRKCTQETTSSKRAKQDNNKEEDVGANAIFRAWLDAHWDDPYPTAHEKSELSRKTGKTYAQVQHWFINARMRIWRPQGGSDSDNELGGPAKIMPKLINKAFQQKIKETAHQHGATHGEHQHAVNNRISHNTHQSTRHTSASERQTRARTHARRASNISTATTMTDVSTCTSTSTSTSSPTQVHPMKHSPTTHATAVTLTTLTQIPQVKPIASVPPPPAQAPAKPEHGKAPRNSHALAAASAPASAQAQEQALAPLLSQHHGKAPKWTPHVLAPAPSPSPVPLSFPFPTKTIGNYDQTIRAFSVVANTVCDVPDDSARGPSIIPKLDFSFLENPPSVLGFHPFSAALNPPPQSPHYSLSHSNSHSHSHIVSNDPDSHVGMDMNLDSPVSELTSSRSSTSLSTTSSMYSDDNRGLCLSPQSVESYASPMPLLSFFG